MADDGERSKGWNYEAAGIDWEERAHLAAAVAGKNAIRAQDAEAEVEALRGQLQGAVSREDADAALAAWDAFRLDNNLDGLLGFEAACDALNRLRGQ